MATKYRADKIYVQARKHVITVNPKNGNFIVRDSNMFRNNKFEYMPDDLPETFEGLFLKQFGLSENPHAILKCFYQSMGTMLAPNVPTAPNIVFAGPEHSEKRRLATVAHCIAEKICKRRISVANNINHRVEPGSVVFKLCPSPTPESESEQKANDEMMWRGMNNNGELHRIFSRSIAALSEVIRNGKINIPKECIDAERELNTDWMDRFIDERLIKTDMQCAWTRLVDIYNDFVHNFFDKSGLTIAPGIITMHRELIARGYMSKYNQEHKVIVFGLLTKKISI